MITCERGHLSVDGRPFFLNSGEIHYFRIEPGLWEAHLRAARAAGLNAVSSYVPWSWHEPAEGRFDFTGRTHPRRDLVRFLDLVARHRLGFVARVGPVSNAELVNEGVPGWLLEGHPEVYVRGRELTGLPHTTLLAYLNPTFLRYAGLWHEQVLPLVRERAHPRGPVILVQLDNEIGMVHWLQKAADYSPETERRYRDFLRARYHGNLGALSRAHGTPFRDFAEIAQPASVDMASGRGALWDWMAFYQAYFAEYFEILHARYRRLGLELPVLANIPGFYDFDARGRGVYAPMTAMMFRDFRERVPGVVLGGAYQSRRVDYENFHDLALVTEVIRMIGAPESPVICAELQTGLLRDRPRLYPQDVELLLKTGVAHGLNGVNDYMFSGGRDDLEMGAFGSYHEWQAPVTAAGARRPHFRAVADFGRQMRAFGPRLAETRKRTDLAVGFYAPYWTTEFLTGEAVERWEWKKHHLFFDGLARLLQLAHLNFSLVDLERAGAAELARLPALVVFAMEFMDAATQAKLLAYVQGGGQLLLNPEVPVADLAGEPCTVLGDGLGVAVAERRARDLRYRIGASDYLAQGEIAVLEAPRGTVAAQTLDGRPCGARVRAGSGTALVLAFGMSHMFDYQVELVREFAAALGVRPSIEAPPDLQVCLREGDGYGFLVVANYHDVPAGGKLRLTLPGEARPTTLPGRGQIALGPRRAYLLPLNLPLGGGEVLRYTTAEVLDIGRRRLLITGARGATGEIELVTRARGARLDGRPAPARRQAGRLRVAAPLSGEPQLLTLV